MRYTYILYTCVSVTLVRKVTDNACKHSFVKQNIYPYIIAII